jgi:hypothetical protein
MRSNFSIRSHPEAISSPSPKQRAAWTNQYLDTIFQRCRDVSDIEKLDKLPRFIRDQLEMGVLLYDGDGDGDGDDTTARTFCGLRL